MWSEATRETLLVARRLLRTSGFTGVTVTLLGIGIGATTALFSVIDAVLLEPLPFDEPEELVGVWLTSPGDGIDWLHQSPATYFTMRGSRSLESVALWAAANVTITGETAAERMLGMMTTPQIFDVLGLQPALGRAFTNEDDMPESPRTVILGHGYWQRSLGLDPGVVGSQLIVNGSPAQVIGVMPASFQVLDYSPDILYTPRFNQSGLTVGDFSYRALGRLAEGVTLTEATTNLQPTIAEATRRFPGGMSLEQVESDGLAVRLRPLREELVGDIAPILWMSLGTVLIVLLTACSNVANLMLVRGEARRRETAIRKALGAGRGRVAVEHMSESVALGLLGGLLGVLGAHLGLRTMVHVVGDSFPRAQGIALDSTGLMVATLVALTCTVVFGMLPTLRLMATDAKDALQETSRGGGLAPRVVSVRNGLVIAQIGLAMVLVVASGLMVRSAQALRSVEVGFSDPAEVLTLRVSVPEGEIADPEQVFAFHEEVIRELSQLPGVVLASGSNSAPMDGARSNQSIFIEDFPTPTGDTPPQTRIKWAAGQYFETLGNRVQVGRGLTWDDARGRSPVVVVNEAYATRFWGSPRGALGRRVRYGSEQWHEIVGVVGNPYDDGLAAQPAHIIYWPLAVDGFWGGDPWVPRWFVYTVRTSLPDPLALLPAVRAAVHRVNPAIPVFGARTLADIVSRSVGQTTTTLAVMGAAALVSMLLALIGIYGVITYGVGQRAREIAIRVALGARVGDIRGLVLQESLALIFSGIGSGLVVALVATPLIRALLFGVEPLDAPSYLLGAAAVTGVSLMAAYLPARRASRSNPGEVLNGE